jgi:hypothetical protein
MVALVSMSDEGLNDFQSMISNGSKIFASDVAAILADRISRLHRFIPPPVADGFGNPSYTAKFDHWARMPRLSLHEVSRLSLGADPNCMKDHKFAELKKTQEREKSLWSAHASFL